LRDESEKGLTAKYAKYAKRFSEWLFAWFAVEELAAEWWPCASTNRLQG
jgi:hypothetical protein